MSADESVYGPVLAPLIDRAPPMSLGPGSPGGKLDTSALTVDKCFAHATVVDPRMARAAVAGVLLLHDELERSHTISQGIDTPTGSYWHGIMHRREPDYSNAKHWFGNVGEHPIYPALLEAAEEEAQRCGAQPHAAWSGRAWDPFAFIDLIEQAEAGGDEQRADLCRAIQMREWRLLFDYSYRHATA